MWTIVHFYKEKPANVELVPKCWLEQEADDVYCFWPNFSDKKELFDKAVELELPPESHWKRCPALVLGEPTGTILLQSHYAY